MEPFRLSYSTLQSLHTCERKFQLDKLLVSDFSREDSPSTIFGKAWGEGVTSYLQHQDQDLALLKLFLAYNPLLEDSKKDQAKCCYLLMATFPLLDNILQDWELVSFNDKPAIELSFRLNISSAYYFVGYVDFILKNRWTGKYAIFDNKTTGLALHDLSPLYQNSEQLIGYSIVLDQIVGEENSEYEVLYLVGQLDKSGFNPKPQLLSFPKTLNDRLMWFISLGMDVKHLEEMEELGVYPKRGGSCLQYMRPCIHMGTCQLHSFDRPKERERDETVYDFTFSLEGLIENHVARISQL